MSMDITTSTTADNLVHLHGTFHQGDEVHFMDYSRGRQCVMNSVVAIALSKICLIRQWTTEHLDSILKAGDILYQQVWPKEFFDQYPLDNGLLELEDIPVECDIFNRHFEIHSNGSIDCCINVGEIRNCLCNWDCEAIVIMGDQYGAYASCLIQYSEKIYIFDPHSLSHVTGMPCADGTSVLLVFDSISKYAEYLVYCANARHAIQLSMWKLVVTEVQQYQYGEKLLKFPRKTLQMNFEPSVAFSNEEHQRTNMKSCTSKIENRVPHSKRIDYKITHSSIQNKDTKGLDDTKKKENQKSAHTTQLRSKHIITTSEENILTNKLRHTKYKIKDRQYQISKLQKQIDAHIDKNDSQKKYSYLWTQVSGLQEQISKLETLVEDLTDKKHKVYEEKKSIEKKLQLFGKKIADKNITLDTANLPKTNSVTSTHQNEHQNLSSEIITEKSKLPQSSEKVYTELPAKKPRYSRYKVNELDKSMHDEHKKFIKREYMKQKCLSTEYRQKENLKQRQHNAQRRSSTEFREKENLKQREHDAQRRSSTEFREKENLKQKEHDAQRQSSTEFREKENLKQRERDAQRWSSTEFREKENLKKKEYQMRRCSSTEFRDEENAHKQARTQVNIYGNSLSDSIKIFLGAVSQGPIYVCSSCLQTQFADNVIMVSTLHPGKHQSLLEECLTQHKSIDEKEWICLSCKREIYGGFVPKLSQMNKVGFPEKPPELDLNRLEEFFIAPLSAFMTIRSLPVCGLVSAGQKLLIGNVVHVANGVGTTVSTLPCMLDDMDTVAVRIKRKKAYKTVVFAENVRPLKVVKALEYLIRNSEMYKPYNIQVPEKWLDHMENSIHYNRYFVEGKYPPATEGESTLMEDSNVTNTQFEEVSSAEMTQGNMDTMLTENIPNITHICDQGHSEDYFDVSNKILTLAPGEGKIPVFRDPLAEYLVFPTKFCGQTRPSNSERRRDVHTSDIFKAELKHKDKRVCLDPANIFWKAKHLQIQKFASRITLALRHVVGSKQQNITAERLLDKEQREDIRRQNDGYHIYKDIPNTPPYFEKLGRELHAMVRQLGNPTIFISLSSADTSWVPLQQALGLLLDEVIYSEDFIKEEMSFEKKCQQVSSHPAACSRYFHHRIQKFFKYIIMGPHSPFGRVMDYAHRTEFQKRGSPHIHGLLWVDNAPKFGISSDKEICKYIDSCISCSLAVREKEKPFVKLQIHKHSRTCKKMVKRKPTCRFGVPWPPMQETRIFYPLGTESNDEISVLQEQYRFIMSKLNKLPEDVETHESWLTYNSISEDTYISIIRSTLKHPKVFLKRKPTEHRVNTYMKGLLGVWQGNHDVQFVLDPYQCVTYICDYMMKSQKGTSDLLRAACEEAKAGNMNLREQVRHMGNKFLNAVEEPIQACCYEILQLPISNSTRKKEFINTSPPGEHVGLTKSLRIRTTGAKLKGCNLQK